MSCCNTRAWSQGGPSLAKAWLSLPWQGLREPGDLQTTPGSAILSSYIQKQTLFIFSELWNLLKKKVYSTTREWNTQQSVTRIAYASSHCHHSLLLLGTPLSVGALSGNGSSTRHAGLNYLLLVKESSPKAHILVKRPLPWQPTTERWSSLPEAHTSKSDDRVPPSSPITAKAQYSELAWGENRLIQPSVPSIASPLRSSPNSMLCLCCGTGSFS